MQSITASSTLGRADRRIVSSTVAITGAAGHIGRALIDALGPACSIRAIDVARRPVGLGANVEWVRTDVRNRGAMTEALADIDTVFHLAAVITISPADIDRAWDVNVSGVEATAWAALDAGVDRFVHCSSIHAFDSTAGTGPLTEASSRSFSPHLPSYDRSKAEGERRARVVREHGLDVVVVHPAGVIGPGDHVPSLMGRMLRRVVDGTLPGVVRAPFEWVDVRDVAAALIAAGTGDVEGRSYLLGGHHVGIDVLAGMVARAAGTRPPRVFPMWLALAAARSLSRVGAGVSELITPDALFALRHGRSVDDRAARQDLGHAPRPLEATVWDVVEWLHAERTSTGQAVETLRRTG